MLQGKPHIDGAGVRLTQVLDPAALGLVDPFLMLDEFRSDDPDAYVAGFPDHPHRGFETITYMIAGRMRHRDSKGNDGLLGPGDVQWMTAARGIIHSEMPEQEEGLMQGFQFWLNLPASEKMGNPRYVDIPAADIPVVRYGGAAVKVIAGKIAGQAGPVRPASTDPYIFDLVFDEDGAGLFDLPRTHAAFAYVYEGSAEIAGRRFDRGRGAVLGAGDVLTIAGIGAGARVLLAAGRSLKEPVARYGPFVMNTEDEIRQAFTDYHAGRF
jgi:redox-sensitive bicupin YhaK (pirin superfamily)